MSGALDAALGGQSGLPMNAQPASPRLDRIPGVMALRERREPTLVREAQRGSAEAMEELFRRHWRRTHRAAFLVVGDSAAAADIAQESFLAAIRALDRFDRRRPFGPWLHRIAVNRAIDFARSRALRRESAISEAPAAAAWDPDPLSEELLSGLAELTPEHRAVIVLRHLLGYTPGEIGEILGIARGTVNSRLRRGLDRLRPAGEEARE